MDFYEKLLSFKKTNKLNNNDLGALILMNGDTFRKALTRKSLSDLEIKALELFMNKINDKLEHIDNLEINSENSNTGFYYPDIYASAGLETEILNNELTRMPVSIPNWEKGIEFINVYGDSMYPKYCAGEIIGIKEVEYQYLNFGYAYVNNPELLLQMEPSIWATFYGMINGIYTGKKLSDYFNSDTDQPVNARRIINGVDCAILIKQNYLKFLKCLK